eukprot:IDg17437t1
MPFDEVLSQKHGKNNERANGADGSKWNVKRHVYPPQRCSASHPPRADRASHRCVTRQCRCAEHRIRERSPDLKASTSTIFQQSTLLTLLPLLRASSGCTTCCADLEKLTPCRPKQRARTLRVRPARPARLVALFWRQARCFRVGDAAPRRLWRGAALCAGAQGAGVFSGRHEHSISDVRKHRAHRLQLLHLDK